MRTVPCWVLFRRKFYNNPFQNKNDVQITIDVESSNLWLCFFQNEKEMKFSQKHFFKFMLVRHPMERLVSCYFDKMVNGTHKSLKGFRKFVKLRAEKIRQERKDKLHRFGGSVYNPTYKDDRPIGKPNFLKCLLVPQLFKTPYFWIFRILS